MGIGDVIKRVFGSGARDDEEAEHEEYKLADRGEADLRAPLPDPFRNEAGIAADELEDTFKAPPDPNP